MKRILCATDFTARSEPALARAAQLAGNSGAELVVCHVLDDESPRKMASAHRDLAEDLLMDLAGQYGGRWRIDSGDVFEAILAAAEAESAELIVLGAPRRGSLRRLFLGTTAERTIRHAGIPVLMVLSKTAGAYRRALLASDFSDGAARAAEAVSLLGLDPSSQLLALNVFDTPALLPMTQGQTPITSIEQYILEERQRADENLSQFLKAGGLEKAVKLLKQSQASVGRTICAAAREADADLIIMGTRGQSGLARLLLGSVTEEVLRLSDIDVLAVPPGQG